MLIRRPDDIPSSEITPYKWYVNRRHFVGRSAKLAAAAALVPGLLSACEDPPRMEARTAPRPTGDGSVTPGMGPQEVDWKSVRSELDESLTPYADVTGYNNFYEFGTGKEDPARNAHTLVARPWTVAVEGEVARPAVYDLDDLLAPHGVEERVYRLRCVEAWSMVIPWSGVALGDVIRRLEPTSRAKYVEFTTLLDPEQMPAGAISRTRTGLPCASSCRGSMGSRASSPSSGCASSRRCPRRAGHSRRRESTGSTQTSTRK